MAATASTRRHPVAQPQLPTRRPPGPPPRPQVAHPPRPLLPPVTTKVRPSRGGMRPGPQVMRQAVRFRKSSMVVGCQCWAHGCQAGLWAAWYRWEPWRGLGVDKQLQSASNKMTSGDNGRWPADALSRCPAAAGGWAKH